MVCVTCYGGVNQIGGNKLALEDGDSRLFFDFGTPFHDKGLYYEEFLNPRPGFGLLDPVEMGLIPPLRGLYRSDLEPNVGDMWEQIQASPLYRDFRDVNVEGVLLSHAHLDHSGYISFLRPDIPIFTTALTAFIAKAIQDTDVSDFEREVIYAVPRESKEGILQTANWKNSSSRQRPFYFTDASPSDATLQDFWQNIPSTRGLEPIPYKKSNKLGAMEVRTFPVDHSIPGSSAFAVKTSAGWIAYTGDIRFHGYAGTSTRKFIEELKKLKPIALLCEGTRAGFAKENETNFTEGDVYDRASKELKQAKGLVIADFGPRNIERLKIFAELAKEASRSLVILPKDAYLLKAARIVDSSMPQLGADPSIYVFDKPKSKADKWEQEIKNEFPGKILTTDDIRRSQESYVLCFSFFDLNQLPSIQPKPWSLYLYSSHEAFDEETQLDFRRLRNWLDHFQMREVGLPLEELEWKVPEEQQGLHASGHASAKDLIQMIHEVSPQYLIPIHIQRDGLNYYDAKIKDPSIKIIKPSLGMTIRID